MVIAGRAIRRRVSTASSRRRGRAAAVGWWLTCGRARQQPEAPGHDPHSNVATLRHRPWWDRGHEAVQGIAPAQGSSGDRTAWADPRPAETGHQLSVEGGMPSMAAAIDAWRNAPQARLGRSARVSTGPLRRRPSIPGSPPSMGRGTGRCRRRWARLGVRLSPRREQLARQRRRHSEERIGAPRDRAGPCRCGDVPGRAGGAADVAACRCGRGSGDRTPIAGQEASPSPGGGTGDASRPDGEGKTWERSPSAAIPPCPQDRRNRAVRGDPAAPEPGGSRQPAVAV